MPNKRNNDREILFLKDTGTTETYTLSLHDALPIYTKDALIVTAPGSGAEAIPFLKVWGDRKSTRLNSSHVEISYAVFCLEKNMEIIVPFLLEHRVHVDELVWRMGHNGHVLELNIEK